MNKKLFVGRLPFEFTNDQLRALFIKSGTVVSALMVPDAKNGRTRGFGFVDMSTEAEAQNAIQTVNGVSLEDKKIWVTLAREKGEAPKPASFAPKEMGRRPFNDRSGPPRFGPKPGFGPKKHFIDAASAAPGDRRPPFRGKRVATGQDTRAPGASFGDRPPFRSGERRPFRSADARPGGPPRKNFSGPAKRMGKRPPPRS